MSVSPLAGERLDQYIVKQMPGLSRSSIAKLIEQGKVSVNSEPVTKTGYKLKISDSVAVNYDADNQPEIPDIDLEIIYEDNDCLVINKPLGLLTHSKGAFNPEATIATWLSKYTSNMTGDRAGIVHRLDRATTGVMIAAKTPEALGWLQKQFSKRKVKKTYIAVVTGVLKQDEAIIDMPIERNPKKPQTFRVGSNGKSAVTAYKVIKSNDDYSLIELKPTTGRTHQLRVHLMQLGHPIVGDVIYGGEPADRLYLHALELEITLPSRERKKFKVPVSPKFNKLVT